MRCWVQCNNQVKARAPFFSMAVCHQCCMSSFAEGGVCGYTMCHKMHSFRMFCGANKLAVVESALSASRR